MKEKYVKTFLKVMRKEAVKNVNSTCAWVCHQPKEPSALLKLKKKQEN